MTYFLGVNSMGMIRDDLLLYLECILCLLCSCMIKAGFGRVRIMMLLMQCCLFFNSNKLIHQMLNFFFRRALFPQG